MAKTTGPIANRPLADEELGGPDAELLRVARERYQKSVDSDRENREAGLEDLEFLAGEQWPEEIREERQGDGRPVLTINRMPQFVRQVTGDVRQNRPAIKVWAADDEADDDTAKLYSGMIRQIENASDAKIAYEHASEGAAQCGIGHFRIVTEYSTDDTFEQNIRIRLIRNHFGVTWDPQAVQPSRVDARYCFIEEEIDIETFKARYPDADTTGWDFRDQQQSWLGDWLQHETVRVAEYWTVEKEQRLLALLADGRTIDITDIEDQDGIYYDEENMPLQIVRDRKVWRNKVEMRIINGAEVLEGPFQWPGKYIPVVPVLGEEIHLQDTTVRFGVIRHAKDSQRMYNYWTSAQTEKIALEPKAPWLVTPGNIKGVENTWRQANTRNLPYLPYLPDKDNQGAAPARQAPQMGSSAMASERLAAADDMKATTGIYDAGLGAKSNETSGVAIRARQQESDVSTLAYIDNLARAIRHAGRILVDLIPKVYDTQRVVRIMNDDETTESVQINQVIQADDGEHRVNDLSLGKYDVVVTTGPSFTTKRAEAVEGIMQLVQAVPEIGSVIMDILVRNLDWPGAEEISERLKKSLPPGLVDEDDMTPEDIQAREQAAQMQETHHQMEMAKMQAEIAKIEAQGAKDAASIAKTEAETEGQDLENAEKALQLAMADGSLQAMISQQIEIMLAQMFQPPPPAGPGVQ